MIYGNPAYSNVEGRVCVMGRSGKNKGTRRKGRAKKGTSNETLDIFIEGSGDGLIRSRADADEAEGRPTGTEPETSKGEAEADEVEESVSISRQDNDAGGDPNAERDLPETSPPENGVENGKPHSAGNRFPNISLMERSGGRSGSRLRKERGIEEVVDVVPRSSPSINIDATDITSEEARFFLRALKSCIGEKEEAVIYFHNDMDGLNGALFIYEMLKDQGLDRGRVHVSPLEYQEIPLLEMDRELCYIFIDLDMELEGSNIFRVDHHAEDRDLKMVTEHLFLLSPPENDYEYPSSSAGLCAYLLFVHGGGRISFLEYLKRGKWQKDPFSRLLILLASVCDNLWHLNFVIDIPMKLWVPDIDEERYLILISISASILLGENESREEIVKRLFVDNITTEEYLSALCSQVTGAQNILSFAETISREAESFYNRIFFNITDSIDKTLSECERDRKLLEKLDESMPIDMRGSREKMLELYKTRGDPNDDHWKRIEFYGKEMERLENKIKMEEKKLLKLRAAKRMFSSGDGPRLCVVIPRQGSKQVKGIIASLLYYKGWKNIVIEERGSEAAWGARGFSKKMIDSYFSNLSLGYDELKDYLFLEKVYKELPDVFRRTVNISRNISFYKTYEGGMGGRGHIFGGSLRGRVPWIFSILEESGDMEEKVRELMKHKELGSAMQGLTEGQSTVSTAQALRAKFKSTGWLVVSLVPGKEGADILLGNFKMGILHLVGYNERIQFDLIEREASVRMDHSRFDIAD
ncbi:hypothetical protein B6U90_02265 [Thermoplasmatales archaeon ex4484_6]|nr:MAG: hypothetical protein B6U90_02265 [Thermoplasmatales archaeon ex4484_6]